MPGFMAGAIVSKLTLDKSQWSQSVSSVKKDEKTMKGMSTRMAGGFKKMGMAMTVAGAAIVASIGKMVKKYVSAGDEVHKMALRTGFATETLSELRYVADIAGTDIGSLEKGVKKMSKTIVDAGSGLMTYVRSFDRIGISIKDLEGLNPEEQFLKISYAIADLEDPTLRAATAQEIFGRAGTMLLPMFAEGSAGMEKLREEARKLGFVYDQEAADKAARLADAQVKLKASLAKVSSTIVETLVPHLSKLVEGLSKTIAKIGDWIKAHPGLTGAIIKVVAGLGAMLTVLGPLLIMLPKMVVGVGMLKTAFITLATGPVGVLLLALGALVVMYQKVKKAQDAVKSAAEREDEQIQNQGKRFGELANAVNMTSQARLKLIDKYDRNYSAMFRAIKQGDEGLELQKAIEAQIKVRLKQQDAEKNKTEGVTKAHGMYNTVVAKTPGLIKTMTDQVKKYTLDEYTYREEKAREIYEERKALLESEGADAEALALLERTLTLELKDIEDDRTEAYKQAQKEKTEADDQRVKDQKALLDTAEGFIDGYTDTVMQYTKDEMEYKNWALDEWYKRELQTLKDSLGNTDLYIKAKEALEKAYAIKVTELNKTTTEEISRQWQMVADGLGASFGGFVDGLLDEGTTAKENLANLWEDIKGTFRGVIADMAREWMTGFIKNLITGATQAGTSIASSLGSSITTLSTGLTGLVTSVGQALISVAKAIATSAQILATAAGALVKVGLVAIALYAAFGLVKGILGKIFGAGKGGEADIVQELKKVVSATEYVRNHWRKSHKRWMDTDRSAKKIVTINRAILKTNRAGFREVVKAIKQVKLDVPGAAKGEYVPRPSLRVVAEEVPEVIAPVPEIQHMVESAAEMGTRTVPVAKQVNVVHTVNLKYELRDIIDGESVRKLVREKVLPETIETLRVNFKGMLSEAKKALT